MRKWFRGFLDGVILTSIAAILGVMAMYVEIRRPVEKPASKRFAEFTSKK